MIACCSFHWIIGFLFLAWSPPLSVFVGVCLVVLYCACVCFSGAVTFHHHHHHHHRHILLLVSLGTRIRRDIPNHQDLVIFAFTSLNGFRRACPIFFFFFFVVSIRSLASERRIPTHQTVSASVLLLA